MSDNQKGNVPEISQRDLELMKEPSFQNFGNRLNGLFSQFTTAIAETLGQNAKAVNAISTLHSADDYTFNLIYDIFNEQLIFFANSLVEIPPVGRGSLNALMKLRDVAALEALLSRYTEIVPPSTLAALLAIGMLAVSEGYELHRTPSPGEFPDLVLIDRVGSVGLIYLALRPREESVVVPSGALH